MRITPLRLAALLLALTAMTAACGGGQRPGESAVSVGHDEGGHSHHHEHEEAGSSSKWQGRFDFADAPVPNKPAELRIRVQDRDRVTLKAYEVSHEKLMHLIVVNRELTHFDHLHPDPLERGAFGTAVTFPAAGSYKLFVDFVPKGGAGATVSDWVTVGDAQDTKPKLAPDVEQPKTAGHLEASLAVSSLRAGEDATLTFTMRDAATKEAITDLEPYLGAVGHVVILSEDAERYLHVHPLDERATGPEAAFGAVFPAGGLYKLWGQFQHRGEVFTFPFVVGIQD